MQFIYCNFQKIKDSSKFWAKVLVKLFTGFALILAILITDYFNITNQYILIPLGGLLFFVTNLIDQEKISTILFNFCYEEPNIPNSLTKSQIKSLYK